MPRSGPAAAEIGQKAARAALACSVARPAVKRRLGTFPALLLGVKAFQRLFRLAGIPLMKIRKLLFGKVFSYRQLIVGAFDRDDQFCELDLQRHCVAVLAMLEQEHHQERDDSRAGVDDELPGIAEAEEWPGGQPNHDDSKRAKESAWLAGHHRSRTGKAFEPAQAHACIHGIRSVGL